METLNNTMKSLDEHPQFWCRTEEGSEKFHWETVF